MLNPDFQGAIVIAQKLFRGAIRGGSDTLRDHRYEKVSANLHGTSLRLRLPIFGPIYQSFSAKYRDRALWYLKIPFIPQDEARILVDPGFLAVAAGAAHLVFLLADC
ncbi:MAG: hypothetical protein ACFB0E_23290 [Leptolyngbyaceae cyanobacterium]